jgi:hypothetical protein
LTPNQYVHEAVKEFCADGELITYWTLTAEVVMPDGGKYLMHRHGGGLDGEDKTTVWHVAGMVRAAMLDIESQLDHMSTMIEDDDDDPDED